MPVFQAALFAILTRARDCIERHCTRQQMYICPARLLCELFEASKIT